MDYGFGIVSGTGGCQCGVVRYRLTAPATSLFACHCRQCRRQSASAFGISLIVPAGGAEVTHGKVTSWSRPTASGDRLDCDFCPTCGTRLWHRSARGGTISVKGGSLDDSVAFNQAVHIWTAEMLPGVPIPENAECYPGEPPE